MFDTFSTLARATRRVTRRGNSFNCANLALLALLLASASTWSAPSSTVVSAYVCAEQPCELAVDGVSGLNVLSWDRYNGDEFTPFGFDIHYTGSSTAPGFEGEGRIQAGGRGVSYTDPSNPPRCSGFYHVRVYSRGRKFHTPALSTAAPACGGTDTEAPVVSIDTPAANAVLGAIQFFQGTVTDTGGSGVAEVLIEIFDRGTDPINANNRLADDSATLNGNTWSLSAALPDGSYDLYAIASDGAGNTASQGPRLFSVQIPADDSIAPVLTMQFPQEGATVDMPMTVSGTVNDEGGSGVALVYLRIDDNNANSVINQSVVPQGESWSFVVNSLVDSDYTVYADTSDGAGNPADTLQRSISVENVVDSVDIADGYDDTSACGMRDGTVMNITSASAQWASDFNGTAGDFHDLLATQWKSRYQWRQPDTDVVTNSESQTYLDVLGYDAGFRNDWSPFEQIIADDGNGYLAIRAKKSTSALPDSGPTLNGAMYGGQPYLSGVLTTYDTLPLSPGAGQTITVEIKAKMPRGQGLFPAFWAYPIDFAYGPKGSLRNNEFDLFEYIGQSPTCDNDSKTMDIPECYSAMEATYGWDKPDSTSCPECPDWRLNNDTFNTQYHNYHTPAKGKLQNIGNSSGFGAVYTNSDGSTPWRGATWASCGDIDFSAKLHTYTLQWSADALVVYIDHIQVLRVDEVADTTWLPGVNFVPVTTEGMALILNLALSSKATYLGAPDTYTEGAMEDEWLKMIVDYVKVWY